jgi:hypothetical protein
MKSLRMTEEETRIRQSRELGVCSPEVNTLLKEIDALRNLPVVDSAPDAPVAEDPCDTCVADPCYTCDLRSEIGSICSRLEAAEACIAAADRRITEYRTIGFSTMSTVDAHEIARAAWEKSK